MTIYEAFIWELTVAVLPQHRYNMHLLAVDARSQCAFRSKSRPKTRYIITRTKETDIHWQRRFLPLCRTQGNYSQHQSVPGGQWHSHYLRDCLATF